MSENKSEKWSFEETLTKEFESVGFYISNHPLKYYEETLEHKSVKTYKDFESGSSNEALIAGTILSIKEKKTSKGTPFAIVKFSDLSMVYEIFLFSEILEKNRQILKEGKSFLITVIKDRQNESNRFRRLAVRNIISLSNLSSLHYSNVLIELYSSKSLDKLYESIKEIGDTKIKISINENDKNYIFELKNKRKFNFELLKILNKEQYIKKISV